MAHAVLQKQLSELTGAEIMELADRDARLKIYGADGSTLQLVQCAAPIVFTGGNSAGWSCFSQLRYYRAETQVVVNVGTVHVCGKLLLPQFEFVPEAFSF